MDTGTWIAISVFFLIAGIELTNGIFSEQPLTPQGIP